jgi:Arc/MetJ-type ribon-helix-helix transcriptional regulator
MTLTLKPEVEALLREKLQSGRYQDTNDLIETALHALFDRNALMGSELDTFLQEGIDSADRGELYSEEEARAYIAAERAKL